MVNDSTPNAITETLLRAASKGDSRSEGGNMASFTHNPRPKQLRI
jgi:hypothetical protein